MSHENNIEYTLPIIKRMVLQECGFFITTLDPKLGKLHTQGHFSFPTRRTYTQIYFNSL